MRLVARNLLFAVVLTATLPIAALAGQPHEPGQHAAASGEPSAGVHEQTWLQTAAKVANFAILAGVLAYFLKGRVAAYLTSRETQIRQDLVTAAEMRAAATAQLAEIEQQLQSLPAELAALRAQGAADVVAEQARIAQAAAAERERLIAQTRREIEMRLRVARRQLTEHAAQLAVNVAEERIRRSMTPDDQLRLVDRYTTQLRGAR
jgi:F-type H+-transporting ATPase subunit b